MKPAEVDVAITYYVGITGRDISDKEVAIWVEELRPCTSAAVKAAIRRLCGERSYPNVIQIRGVALAEMRFNSERLELPEPDGISVDEWYANHATDEERALADKHGVRAKAGA